MVCGTPFPKGALKARGGDAMENEKCAGRKGWKGEKLGEGGREQSLEGLEWHAEGSGLFGLAFSQKTCTVFWKPREGGEHYRAPMFRFYVHAYVFF